MTANRVSSVLRHWLWGGVRCFGRADRHGSVARLGGCVIVANHSSHADTAALLAALPPAAQPVFGAAADYWFDVPVRRFVATSLAGILPVRRSGDAYAALLAAARPALKAGRTVVIYPEGTRSTNGSIGEFRSGAMRLARDCGVPVVPVALTGTADVLPKDGSYTSPHRCGSASVHPSTLNTTSAPELRAQVLALRDAPPAGDRRPVRARFLRHRPTRAVCRGFLSRIFHRTNPA